MLGLALALHGSRAADPQPYQVALAPTGDAALDRALADASTLLALRRTAPVGPFPLLARARGDQARLLDVLHGLGHYAAAVAITVDGLPLDDPALPARLEASAAGTQAAIAIAVTPGPLFRLRHIVLTGDLPPGIDAVPGLAPGDPAIAADVLAGAARLLAALRAAGHAFAKVDRPLATLDPAARALDLRFAVAAGPRADLGAIAVRGLERVHDAYVRRRLALQPGEPYRPAALDAARSDLAATGLFTAVTVTTATALDAAGRLPVRVRVVERKPRSVILGANLSTDEGAGANAAWIHRNLFGNAERLTLAAAATNLGGTAVREPGYRLSARLELPDWLQRDQTLALDAAAFRQDLDAYSRAGLTAAATLSRRLSPHLTAHAGLATTLEDIAQEGVKRTYQLLQAPLGLAWDSTDSPLDPTLGTRASLTLTPSLGLGNAGTSTFVIAEAAGSAYLDFGTKGRTVLALRGLVGATTGAGVFGIPPDQRFYAGGGGSVRGFRFQSLGTLFASGRPQGGTAVDTASVELRQRIGASWGAVAFVDAGQIGDGGLPFTGRVHAGAGLGVRYYTAIGPVRFDVAVPLTRQRKGDAFEVYIGLGQAF